MEKNQSLEKGKYVREMFSQIAGKYDLINRLMTGFQDQAWRNDVVARAGSSGLPMHTILDLGTGTGDLATAASHLYPDSRVVGGDFTIEMMRVGKQNPARSSILWSGCDAQQLPFPDQCFDAVVSGFLLRNVSDIGIALQEQYRVLKTGGSVVVLDTTRPPDGLFSPLIRLYLSHFIPLLGGLISGDREAYKYLPSSTAAYLRAEELAERLIEARFCHVGYEKRMFGTIAIHWGIRPSSM